MVGRARGIGCPVMTAAAVGAQHRDAGRAGGEPVSSCPGTAGEAWRSACADGRARRLTFAELAEEPGAQLAELLHAVDDELAGPSSPVTLERLEALTGEVAQRTGRSDPPTAQARALAEVVALRACLRGCSDERPEGLLLTRALVRGRAHPHLLAALYAQVAQWAGLPWQVAARSGELLLIHVAEPPVIVRPSQALRVLSPHAVTFVVLDALTQAFQRQLQLGDAVRAARLRTLLPAAPCCRARAHVQLVALSAALN